MSCVPVGPAASAEACANCGKEGDSAVKLKSCTACRLVRYCGTDCQKAHRKQHKKACKERAAELKDKKLYSQGHERQEADFCPLCLLAIPLPEHENSILNACCMKSVCHGCSLAAEKGGMGKTCPFCRSTTPKTDTKVLEMVMKRVAAKDPVAIQRLGDFHLNGNHGFEKSSSRAFELWSEAAKLGSTEALFKMGMEFYQGDRDVSQDKAKGVRCLESAAMQGCAKSRSKLGIVEYNNGNHDRAVRHFLISAKMGFNLSLDMIRDMFADGLANKAQYAEALKGYQDAVEETKSSQRDEALATGYGVEMESRSQEMYIRT